MVSPDGKYLFAAGRWKSAKFLDELRRRAEGDAPQQDAGRFTDPGDGRVYQTVSIAGKTWMAESLAYKTERGSWAYNDDPGPVTQYGYLYDWATAQAAAPKGWHVATVAEWAALSEHLGGGDTASRKMRSTSGWSCGGTDSVGLAALPTTARGVNGAFAAPPDRVIWWTATATTPDRARYWEMSCSSFQTNAQTHRTVGLPVRCVRDE